VSDSSALVGPRPLPEASGRWSARRRSEGGRRLPLRAFGGSGCSALRLAAPRWMRGRGPGGETTRVDQLLQVHLSLSLSHTGSGKKSHFSP